MLPPIANLKKITVACTWLLLALAAGAQKKAVTENGDEVILYEDGTWKYTNQTAPTDSITTNPVHYTRSPSSTFLLKSKHVNIGFWLDPKKWSFGKGESNESAEYEMDLKGESVNATIVTEEADMSLLAMRNIALTNGRSASADIQIVSQEYRTVNNLKILYLKMAGTIQGIKFSFFGYYYTSDGAAVQFLVSTYPSTSKKFMRDIEDLLNGLVATTSQPADTTKPENPAKKNGGLSQGSLYPGKNCKAHFPGKWEYYYAGKRFEVERTLAHSTEYQDDRKYYFAFDIVWTGKCTYKLIYRRTNKPHFTFSKPGEYLAIEILDIDPNMMQYKSVFRGKEETGEMTRIE